MQGRDPREIGRLHLFRRPAVTSPQVWGAWVILSDQFGAVVVVLVAVIVLILVLVLVVILNQAEIHRHFAHRAGHVCPPSFTPGRPRSGLVPCVGHYRRKGGRPPSNAVPIRTCVAPSAMASPMSALMPADIT